MTTSPATVAPPAADRRYSEQLTTLVDQDTRAYVLGLAIEAAEQGGYARLKEGEQVRELLADALRRARQRDAAGYAHTLRRGRLVLEERKREAATRAADTAKRVKAAKRRKA